MSDVSVRVLRTVAEIEALRPEWNALSAPFGTPLLDHDWLATAAQTLHEEDALRVVTVRQAGTLTGVAPMAISQADRHLVLLGTSALFEPSGWLYSSEAALQQVANAVVDLEEVAVLDRVPASLPLWRLLPQMVRGQAVTIIRETAPSYAVRTDRPWCSLAAGLSSKTRRRLSNARDRAERRGGPVRIQVLTPSSGEVDQLFDVLVTVEAASWKGREGSALAVRPDLSRFFRLYAQRAAAQQKLRVTVLRVGDIVAAVELAVEAHNRWWGLKIAYDERFASCAPALQVVHASIEYAAEHQLQAYEFLGSAESWQKRWRPETRTYRLAAMYPLSRRAVITALYDLAAFVSRRMQPPPRVAQVTP